MEDSAVDPEIGPRLAFPDFIRRLAEIVGEPRDVDAMHAIWETRPYRVVLTDLGDRFRSELFVAENYVYTTESATFERFVTYFAAEIVSCLDGPQPPRPAPQNLPVDEQRIEALQKRLRRIQQQVYSMMDSRRWDELYHDVISQNPALQQQNAILRHFHVTYVDYAVLAVRRQARHDPDSVSLIGLMFDVRDAAATLTREWYHRLWRGETNSRFASAAMAGPFVDRHADELFADFAEPTGERVDPAIVDNDIVALLEFAEPIVHYSDKRTAHDDKKGFDHRRFEGRTVNLDLAVRTVEFFTRRYGQLLLGVVPDSMTPADFGNALRVFRFPWIENDDILSQVRCKYDPSNQHPDGIPANRSRIKS